MVAGQLDAKQLVFVDEIGTNTSLHSAYAWSKKGQRACCVVPRNRGKNTTLLASMSVEGMGPSLAVTGSVNAAVFEAYLEKVLLPHLHPGQIVIMDNLSAHKSERVRKLIEERSCEVLYLPPYSPDNPIAEAFSKVKGILRKAQARPCSGLIEAMGHALRAVSASDARGFFEHSGYRTTIQSF